MYTANGQAIMRGGALVPYSNPYDFSTAFTDDLNNTASAGQAPNPRSVQEFNLRQTATDKFNAAKARLAGSPKIQAAVAGAKSTFGMVNKYLPVIGAVAGVVDGGVEAKTRLDRGEDGQRAAIGGAVKAGANVLGAAGFLTGNPLIGLATSMAAPAVAGFVTDRVTDAIRGNDGKGADGVLKDYAGRIEVAREGGNFAQAAKLTQEALQFQSKAIGQGIPGYADARAMGVAEDDVETFKSLKSQQIMNKNLSEDTFVTTMGQDARYFNQQFDQRGRMLDDQQRRGQIERLRNQVRDTQNKATQVQQDMFLEGSKAINQYGQTVMTGLAQSYQGGGIR